MAVIIDHPFDFERLFGEGNALFDQVKEMRVSYQRATPFPHIVVDNLFDPAQLDEVLATFPDPDADFWHRADHPNEVKLASNSELDIPPKIRLFLDQLNGANFLRFLELLTGVDGLVGDPYFDGGGMHQIQRGGKLAIHADFNKHRRLKLDRRINLLVYLNKNWKEEYGGALELWNTAMTECGQKVLPAFNRCVIFSTTDTSFHGHPDPLNCPEGWTRKSLALYYFSNGRPVHEISNRHATLFRARPGETILEDVPDRLTFRRILKRIRTALRYILSEISPPVLTRAWSAFKNKVKIHSART